MKVSSGGFSSDADMRKADYDSNADGKVNSADNADNIAGADSVGADYFYGTDELGNPGLHPWPVSSDTLHAIRLIYERDGVWKDVEGNPQDRTWVNPTVFRSLSEPAVPPPYNAANGIREDVDTYERKEGADPKVLVIVSDPTLLSNEEQEIVDLFEAFAFAVSVVSDVTPLPASSTYQLIWISHTADEANLNVGFKDLATPIACLRNLFMPILGLIDSGTNTATTSNTETQINIVDGAHDASGDAANGLLTVYSSAGSMQHIAKTGLPVGSETIAEKADDVARATLVAFPSGITLQGGGAAPAKRLFPGFGRHPTRFNDSGRSLFWSSIYWLAGYDF